MKNYYRQALLNAKTQRIVLNFAFDWKLLDKIKKVKGWNYESKSKQWSLPLCENSIEASLYLKFSLSPNLNKYYKDLKNPSIPKKEINITIDNCIRIPEKDLSAFVLEKIRKTVSFTSPNPGGSYPKYHTYLRRDGENYIIPRGALSKLLNICGQLGIKYRVVDNTRIVPEIDLEFKGRLYRDQQNAVKDLLEHPMCILNAPTGIGKTTIALNIIAKRKQPTCILVHNTELLYQWRDRAKEFLGLTEDQIGLVGDGNCSFGSHLTIGIINSMTPAVIKKLNPQIGFLVVDEVHRAPGKTFRGAISQFDCKYILGLSATPYRKDGTTPVISLFCGKVAHTIDPKKMVEQGKIAQGKLVVKKTGITYPYTGNYSEMIHALMANKDRNISIIRDVLEQIRDCEGTALILSSEKEHCKTLYKLIPSYIKAELLTGDKKYCSKPRAEITELLKQGKLSVVVATGQLIGEGFDCNRLSSCFLVVPLSYKGRIIQYIGRILRVMKGKYEALIYDYVDDIGVLSASFKSRCKAYKEYGIIME